MEEYAESKEETVQTAQAESRRSEERGEVNRETEQLVEESRKRKRGDGKQEQRAVEKKLVNGSLIWLILTGEINYNRETS